MGVMKGPSAGGSGGKRGHSNMEHWVYNDEVKEAARKRRRLESKTEVAAAKQTPGVSRDSRLRVDFDDPKHGWIGIKVSAAKQEFADSLSYTPNDFLCELASAVLRALDGQAGIAVAHTEPYNYDFIFTPVEKTGTMRVEIVGYYHSMRKRGETVFTFESEALRIARPFWKALRDAETRLTPDEYREAMRRDFPEATVRRLGERIRNMCG